MNGLSTEELYEEARRAWKQFRGSQEDLGAILDIDRSAISRAVRNEGMKHASVQARIVSYVKGVPVQRRSTYMGSRIHHCWVIDP